MDRIFRKYINADDLQDSGQVLVHSAGLIENGHQQVGADRDPYLGLHGVLAGTVEGLDPEVLLDPFEKQLDLPTRFVDLRHYERVELEVVGEEDQRLSRFRIHVADAPQARSVQALGFRPVEHDGLIGSQPGRLVYRSGLSDVVPHVRLRSDHEECPGAVDAGETLEVEISTIHHVEGSRFEDDPIQSVHVVDFPLRNRHEGGNRAVEVDHGVDLHCGLRSAKARPRKQGHAKVDDRGVQSVDNLIDFLDVSFFRIQFPRLSHENTGELEIDAPVSPLVGVGDVASCDGSANAHRVEKLSLRSQACLDVAQTFAVSKLSEDHAEELVASREALGHPRHRILRYASFELFAMDQGSNLREDKSAGVHACQSQQASQQPKPHSNASHT